LNFLQFFDFCYLILNASYSLRSAFYFFAAAAWISFTFFLSASVAASANSFLFFASYSGLNYLAINFDFKG